MATIEKRETSKGEFTFRVSIRKKGADFICKSFKKEEDAKLFAAWKEDIIDQMSSFNPDIKDLITLEAAIDLKILDLSTKNAHEKTISDLRRIGQLFEPFMKKFISEITYNDLLERAKYFMTTKVQHGGNLKGAVLNQESMKPPSKRTIQSRFNVLQSIYSFLIQKNINVENHPQKILKHLKSLDGYLED